MQASLAADYSIVQFSHLARLLLWHGRNSCALIGWKIHVLTNDILLLN